ncbi:hypothetical protein EYR41_010070 [Orbilia oligospora]|uniref:Uncharacterized protein n=1 Tax=Orbilia oligospora TaxID=2813651 RepID=A0A8H2DS88_ORBOL|nr:hypothetical protein EYR41_010070 [Orbilia oligospora]
MRWPLLRLKISRYQRVDSPRQSGNFGKRTKTKIGFKENGQQSSGPKATMPSRDQCEKLVSKLGRLRYKGHDVTGLKRSEGYTVQNTTNR